MCWGISLIFRQEAVVLTFFSDFCGEIRHSLGFWRVNQQNKVHFSNNKVCMAFCTLKFWSNSTATNMAVLFSNWALNNESQVRWNIFRFAQRQIFEFELCKVNNFISVTRILIESKCRYGTLVTSQLYTAFTNETLLCYCPGSLLCIQKQQVKNCFLFSMTLICQKNLLALCQFVPKDLLALCQFVPKNLVTFFGYGNL